MAITLSTGTGIDIARTYGPAVNMTAITNATNAVATLGAGHAVVVGDFLEVTSGWARLNLRIARVSAVVTNDVTLEAINTVSTARFPPGAGTGSIRRITQWDEIQQIREATAEGGDQQFVDITDITDVTAKQVPTIRNPVTLNLTVMDDPALPWYATALAAADAQALAALRMRFPNGSRLLANGYWSVQRTPMVAKNEVLTCNVNMSYAAEATRYAT